MPNAALRKRSNHSAPYRCRSLRGSHQPTARTDRDNHRPLEPNPDRVGLAADPAQASTTDRPPRIDAPELRAKADTRVLPGVPLGAKGFGRAPGKSGETASQLGSGEVGEARSDAIGAIEHSDVPEEYREHVGRYFEPELGASALS